MKKAKEKKANNVPPITAEEFDAKFDRGEDITPWIDFEKSVFVRRVNVDFPDWMIKRLDQEAKKLNVSRQAIIKMWLADRMGPASSKLLSEQRKFLE